MTASNQIPATETKDFVTIPEHRYQRILWDIRVIENTFRFLHKRLQDLQKADGYLLMTVSETAGFSKAFFEAFENWHEITTRLKQADDCRLREIGERFQEYVNHAEFVVNFLSQREGVGGESRNELDHDGIYRSDLGSILLLTNEICSKGLPCYIRLFEEIFSSKTAGNSQELNTDCIDDRGQSYESLITKRIKAIEPKFEALSKKYHHHEGSELLTNPEAVLKATESLRNEIQGLQNKTPKDSEEWTDCRISIEELDFLIRLINTKFEFRRSDAYALSLIVDQARDNINNIPDWLAPDDGGDLVDIVH